METSSPTGSVWSNAGKTLSVFAIAIGFAWLVSNHENIQRAFDTSLLKDAVHRAMEKQAGI